MMGPISFFLGLQIPQSLRGIFINQSKYASKIVTKYGMLTSDSVDIPMGKPVDALIYRGMIGSLMYLKASRPDLIYVVCLCARYQAKPTENHLQAVKRIFRYLKGTINIDLWYSKDTFMSLVAYADADHASMLFEPKLVCIIHVCDNVAFEGELSTSCVRRVNNALEDRLEFDECNMRLKTDIKPKEATFQVVLDVLALTPFYRSFLITADVPAIYIDLRHTRDITYLTDVNVDYLHQPWRAFAIVMNKCLSGKETGYDKIRLSRAQILWDQSISRRNKMFWHTDRDDTLFTSMRCTSRHEKTQKTPKLKYVQKKADSDTSPKKKHVQATEGTRIKTKAKVAKSDKKKQPAKKPKAKGLAVGSGDGVDTQLKVPDEQQQKTSRTDEGTGTKPRVPDVPIYNSKSDKESWGDSDEEDDDENDFEEEDDINDDDSNDNDESDDERTKSNCDVIPNPKKTNEEHDEQEEKYDDEFNLEEDENIDEEEDYEVTIELYKDVNVNLYNKDANMTYADQGTTEQQNASHLSGFEQEEEDAYVTLTPVLDTQKTGGRTKSSCVSSDFTSKLLNLDNPSPTDNEIAYLIDTTTYYATTIPEITSSFATPTPLPPLFFNPLQQEATPTPTPTTFEATTSFTSLLDFVYVFKFNERVTNLEKDLSEIKKVDQYAQALSSIPTIVDHYMYNKLRDAINKAIQTHNFDCREETQAEKMEYIELVDLTVRTIIKEEVNARLPQILPKAISDVATLVIEKNVTESLEVAVLTRSSSQP
nr:copia protein [Tanacetum cinerariifolium]